MNSESDLTAPSTSKDEPSAFALFLSQIEKEGDAEKKLRLVIDFMRSSLSQSQTPRFKDFWEGRRLCLPLFKENINAKSRALLWAEYVELSDEARKLKEILDEQSAFAVEQIELAIAALEKDLERYDELLTHAPNIDFPGRCDAIDKKRSFYNDLQKELNLLNAFSSRINALRKEIIKTDMRIRYKNRFFERLSQIGDRIFPKRKELIKKVSDEFIANVEEFIASHFQTEDLSTLPLFALREEIKALQAFGKILTLNTQAFTQTRIRLSECWDNVKEREKERKKEITAKRVVFKQNYDLVMEKIKAFAEACQNESLSHEQANAQMEEILSYMKTIELGREEVRELREELSRAKNPLLEKQKKEEQEREQRRREEERQRKSKVEEIKAALIRLLQSADELENDRLIATKDELFKEFEQFVHHKSERQAFERLFKQLKEKIEEKREKAILNLSADDLQAIEQLNDILEEKKSERQEIKNRLENYRKLLGGSGFDFEKAMEIRELIEEEKSHLERLNASIGEIEEKIEEIER
jgi:hypothetical protein